MPVKINKPIVIPPKEEVSADNLLIQNLQIGYYPPEDRYWANESVIFYGEDGEGKKVFARNPDGSLLTETIHIPDLYQKAPTNPKLAAAIVAILEATVSLYHAKKAEEEAAVVAPPPAPPTPSPTPSPEEE